jgi:hypothetical protein
MRRLRGHLRVILVVALAAAILIAAALVATRRTAHHPAASKQVSGRPSAQVLANIGFPALTSAQKVETERYLTSDGAIIGQFRQGALPLRQLSTATPMVARRSVCELVASNLGSVSPYALLQAALGVPDTTLQELTLDDRTTTSNALVACGRGDKQSMDSSLTSLHAVDALTQRRLRELGS